MYHQQQQKHGSPPTTLLHVCCYDDAEMMTDSRDLDLVQPDQWKSSLNFHSNSMRANQWHPVHPL